MINWSTSDIAGIEFGDTHITAARLREKRAGSYLITHAGWVEYDPASSLKEKADAVKALWKQTKMPTKTVCASLRSGSLAVRPFSIPGMTLNEVRAAIDLQAEETLQLPREEIVVEWHTTGSPDLKDSAKTMNGIYAAAPLKDVENELELLLAADLDPVIFDIRALAVVNLRGALKGAEADDFPLCLVNLSAHSADIILQHAPGVIYPHIVFCRASAWADSPEFLIENIRDVMRYGEYKLGWNVHGGVVLMGQITEGARLQTMIHEVLDLEVQVWEPWTEGLETSRAVTQALSREALGAGILVPALGLALRRG